MAATASPPSFEAPPAAVRGFGLRDWFIGLGLCVLTVLAYLPALHSGFIWNDSDYVTKPELRSLAGLGRIWWDVGSTEQYYPLLHSVFWVEHRLWGDLPAGYHLANILLHAMSACLLAAVLRRLSVPGAWLAAAVFALHPVCVESVAWISEEKNTLSMVFYLLAALGYLGWRSEGGALRYGVASFLFVCAVASKSMTATLPAAILVVLWWKEGKILLRRDVLPLVPWFAVGAAGGLFTGWVERTYIGAQGAPFALTLVERVLVAGRIIWFYLGKLVWPVDLIFIYPRWTPDGAILWTYVFPIGAAALAVGLWLVRHRSRGPLAGYLFFVGSLFPVLGFFNVFAFIFSFVADHWQYLACIGIFVPVSAGVSMALDRCRSPIRNAGWAAVIVVLALLGMSSWRQSRMYRDMETFYRTTLAKNPDCWMAHNNLGALLASNAHLLEAIDHYKETIRLKPDYPEARLNYGAALFHLGQFKEAKAEYLESLRLKPDLAEGYYNLGIDDVALALPEAAINDYRQALKLKPAYAEAEYQLGTVLANTGHLDEAQVRLEGALGRRPDLAEAHEGLGDVFKAKGNADQAFREHLIAAQFQPGNPQFEFRLGIDLAEAGRTAEAIACYETALKIKPDFSTAEENLGVILANSGRMPEALRHFSRAVEIDPNYQKAHYDLGQALHVLGRDVEAKVEYDSAMRLKAAGIAGGKGP